MKVEVAGETRLAIPPETYFVGSAVFHYLGPAFAVLLFARVEVAGVAWLRIVSAASVFAIWRRPWRLITNADARGTVVALGAVLAVMNLAFYGAIDRLPLGTVAAIEFVGPVVLAAVGVRSARNLVALAAAGGGVYLLIDVELGSEPLGLLLAFANGALFTLYIVLAHRSSRIVGDSFPVDRLGAAMLVAAVVITPFGFTSAAPALGDAVALLAGVGVGLTSSVIPYVLDQLAMTRLPRSTYALFVALLPATATVVGVVVLRQVPGALELAGVACVVGGIVIHREPQQEALCST